jgi:hypothetical protein
MVKCKEYILSFKNAANIITMCADLWPLKIALFDYIINIYMKSGDPNFMKKPSVADEADDAQNY